jgi:hypothetical protein
MQSNNTPRPETSVRRQPSSTRVHFDGTSATSSCWPATPLPANSTSPYAAMLHEHSPTTAAAYSPTAAMTSYRRNDPYAPLVVHPGLLAYPPLPNCYVLPFYHWLAGMGGMGCYDGLGAYPSCEPAGHFYGADCALPATAPPQIPISRSQTSQRAMDAKGALHPLDISAVSSIDEAPSMRRQHPLPQDLSGLPQRRPGIPQNEFYRQFGGPRRTLIEKSLNMPQPRSKKGSPPLYASHDTSFSSSAAGEPSDRRRAEGVRVLNTTPNDNDNGKTVWWRYAIVQFAFRRAMFHITEELASTCPLSSMVVVEGDRGEDAGVLEQIECVYNREPPSKRLLRVLRLASMAEVNLTHCNLALGEIAAEKVAKLIQNPTELMLRTCVHREFSTMRVIACEYQLDRKRLTVYYSADSGVIHGGIARELYYQFHCRIWMNQIYTPKNARA